jgi:hypothetical protein
MFGLFRKKPLIDAEVMDWMLDKAEWLLSSHVFAEGFAQAGLVLPKPGYFVTDGETDHKLAVRLMQEIQRYAGLPHWKVALTADPRSGRFAASTGPIMVQPKASAAGLYMGVGEDETISISYDSDLLKTPGDFIAVMAHELAHAILDLGETGDAEQAAEEPPDEALEMLTDFTTVFTGFGVFTAYYRAERRVWTREQTEEWRAFHENYMNFNEAAAATALFALVHSMDEAALIKEVSDALATALRTAFRDWEAHRPRIEALVALRVAASTGLDQRP